MFKQVYKRDTFLFISHQCLLKNDDQGQTQLLWCYLCFNRLMGVNSRRNLISPLCNTLIFITKTSTFLHTLYLVGDKASIKYEFTWVMF